MPMEQRSVQNVFASIWGFIEPPSYEKAPKLVNQGTEDGDVEIIARGDVRRLDVVAKEDEGEQQVVNVGSVHRQKQERQVRLSCSLDHLELTLVNLNVPEEAVEEL